MEITIIGVDPHKRSHTAVVLDDEEQIAAELRVTAGPKQLEKLLRWAPAGRRLWAVENANGLGRLLSRQLVGHGEQVVDVPASLAARGRRLSGHSGRKTDAFDARSVVIAARHHGGLRRVTIDEDAEVLGLLLARRDRLIETRTRIVNQLHALLSEMQAGGAKRDLTPAAAARVLARHRPATAAEDTRKQLARELLAEWRRTDRQIKTATDDLADAVTATGTTLTDIPGIATIGAARIIAIVGDIDRFPTPGHFASFTGTAPLEASSGEVTRHRLSRRGNRQLNTVLHIAARTQTRTGGPGRPYYDRKIAEGKSDREALRCLKRQLSNVVYRRLHADRQALVAAARDGHPGTNPKAA
ncbi:MAG: IS110 family transposase [Nitriliruptor sp.]|nr:MAG: IS110 family transposase [Nitriliruptor sp.]